MWKIEMLQKGKMTKLESVQSDEIIVGQVDADQVVEAVNDGVHMGHGVVWEIQNS